MSSSTPTTKKKRSGIIIPLPAGKQEIELPPVPAHMLRILLSRKDQWLNTFQLVELGINSVPYAIRILRANGAVIDTKTGKATNRFGYTSSGVEYYKYRGIVV